MDFASLKQQLDQYFTKIKNASMEGDQPELADVKQFVRLCSQMQNFAVEDWAFEADDFTHLANELLQTVKNENIQDMFHLIHSLEDARNFCHRTFKEE